MNPLPSPASASLQDRFRGALLGTLMGDALGMPWEGWPAVRIRSRAGEVRELEEARRGRGTFTDDTQMTAALARALLSSEDPAHPEVARIAQAFATAFDPDRGYGGNVRRILTAVRAGDPWEEVAARARLPGGSFGNGAAMRVAPAALAAFPSAERTLAIADLQAQPTGHDHPEALFGARLQVTGVLLGLTRGSEVPPPTPAELLETAALGWPSSPPLPFVRRLEWIHRNPAAGLEEAASHLRPGVRAPGSVTSALWAFLSHPDDPEEALVTAVGMGGDTDTVAAMTGALAGARMGASRFPRRWLEGVEGGEDGRDGLVSLADRLYERRAGSASDDASDVGPDFRTR